MTAQELESIARLVLRARGSGLATYDWGDGVRAFYGDHAISISRVVRTIKEAVQDELEVELDRDGGHVGSYTVTALKICNGRVADYDAKLAVEAGAHLLQIGLLDIIAGQEEAEGRSEHSA